eukprot:scaffold8317_cov67-Skeletonema_dohrnii-CCMP3373.AAC.2
MMNDEKLAATLRGWNEIMVWQKIAIAVGTMIVDVWSEHEHNLKRGGLISRRVCLSPSSRKGQLTSITRNKDGRKAICQSEQEHPEQALHFTTFWMSEGAE